MHSFSVWPLPQLPKQHPPARRSRAFLTLAVYTSDGAATDHYYREIIGAAKLPDPENPRGVRYAVNATQFVEVLPLPPNSGINRLDHTAYNTEDADGLRKYLAAKGWKTPASVAKLSDGSRSFMVLDPEGNKVEFVQPPANAKAPDAPKVIGHHIIHIGILVHSREEQDKFYRELLGFRPYWFGGMNYPDKIDWVSQQVPDGHDWVEYMLAGGPGTGIPANMTQQTLGVLDHFAVGQKSVEDAFKVLQAGNPAGRQARRGSQDRQRRQGAAQFVRPGRHSRGADEVPCDREALLLAVYGG